MVAKRIEALGIGRHRMIREVSTHHLRQPAPLLRDRLMHSPLQLCLQGAQLGGIVMSKNDQRSGASPELTPARRKALLELLAGVGLFLPQVEAALRAAVRATNGIEAARALVPALLTNLYTHSSDLVQRLMRSTSTWRTSVSAAMLTTANPSCSAMPRASTREALASLRSQRPIGALVSRHSGAVALISAAAAV